MKRLPALARMVLLLSCLGLAPLAALAADTGFPSRPVTLVIPFPPGGATDVNGRVIAQRLGKELGQPVVIENRGGAGTVIGASYVSKAAPDGYTLLISSGTTFTVNPAIRPNLPYDPVKGFEPIGLAGRVGLILLANSEVPVQTVKQFVDYVKASPGKYSYASFGTGTTSQFAGETILHAAGLKMTHVPYKGSAPAMTDLMGGQVPFSIDTVSAAIPQLKSGKIKAIAVTTAKRSTLLPDVPTMAESGYPEINTDSWLALAAPKGLPPDVKARLEKALAATMADPDTRAKLAAQGLEPGYSNSAAVSELIAKELPLMRAIAARANITAD
ncbi:tripartite-type tricarboxylate transporter receptor subunit TctC [Variovorax beijingensis]|uniref:Tripartite-type tricarboxylate transporter receptor subunit TctC n=2 Tax=Variovorax TaxID=34072 RepID=A0AAE3XS45_VARPD|nr:MULTISPECIES: tripartite tricarboxylate transporter substrate binding protein [Variovorax]MBD9666595.1 tripartite tricarboxylate transporter substrate binding protein [Variovorax sp. VRV01]MDP9966547.1 tripartite-type tricarboxylate transporter receptor subunit TctC [Variovorax paradoxus]MDR6423909.1 tripartite-type tricarboxylate transporter receptor subunit TctC [Variovorax paradoxus]MDR6452817.1 tripartite-type tricarboxylate transporter receptor subunit TctC [Variovorax paradoxus]TWD871